MDAANINHNKNGIPTRKSSAIPRLHNKRNTVEAIIPGKFEEENFKHLTNFPEKNKEDRESCFCTGCYNKTKNLCEFTLNENLNKNLQDEDEMEEDTRSYNEAEDDDVNSTTIMTDGESYYNEDNCINRSKRWGKMSLTNEEATSNEPNSLRNRNYGLFVYDTPTTIHTKESKGITKTLHKTSTDFKPTDLRMRKDDEPEKFSSNLGRNNCAFLKKSETKSTEHIKGCLVTVSTRNRLKYTLTNVTKVRPEGRRTCFSRESSSLNSRCITPTKLNLRERREKLSDLNVAKLHDDSNSKTYDNCSVQEQINLDNYICQSENNPLCHLFRTANPSDNNVSGVQENKSKNCECVSQVSFDTLVNTTKENKCVCLMKALLEVFGNDSHITQKIRNSTLAKYDTRFRNIRSAESYNLESDDENKIKTHTSCSYSSIESDSFKKDQRKEVYKNDGASIHTLSSLGKSLPETFSSVADMDVSKRSKCGQRETCISFKRCKCQSLKCYQLNELNESITSMQTEIKTLIKSMPYGKKCTCTISEEISKLKQFYQECQKNEQNRNLQQKKLEYNIKEIYRRIDALIETNRRHPFFKYLVLFPFIGILTVYTVSCLGELKKN